MTAINRKGEQHLGWIALLFAVMAVRFWTTRPNLRNASLVFCFYLDGLELFGRLIMHPVSDALAYVI